MQQTGLASSALVLYNGVYHKQMRISFRKLRNFYHYAQASRSLMGLMQSSDFIP